MSRRSSSADKAQTAFDNLPFQVKDAVRDFRDRNGRSWKRALRDLWETGRDVGDLRTVRNVIGPSGLDGVRL